MSHPTPHVNEDELILHFYGESADTALVTTHLAACPRCRTDFEVSGWPARPVSFTW